MSISIFDHQNYKAYLREAIRARPRQGRGLRSALALALRCQTAYVSQVLKGPAHFSLEQAQGVNDFLGHSDEEAHYFLLLVQMARASTPPLRRYFNTQIAIALEKRLNLKERLGVKTTLGREHQAIYYSHWHYAAIHVALSIQELQSKDRLATYFGVSLKRITEILDFLVSTGLAVETEKGFGIGVTRIHLASDSPLILKHHSNWRLQAIQSLDRDTEKNLHYSSVVTLSAGDALKIRALLVEAIDNAKTIVRDSPAEEIHAFCLDFLKI